MREMVVRALGSSSMQIRESPSSTDGKTKHWAMSLFQEDNPVNSLGVGDLPPELDITKISASSSSNPVAPPPSLPGMAPGRENDLC